MTRRTPTGRYLHYEPERTDYAVSEAELEKLRKGEHPLWKDVVLVTVPLAVSTLTNGIVEAANQTDFKLTLSIFLNFVFGILSVMLAVVFAVAWHRDKTAFESVTESIKNKPRFEVPPGVFDVFCLSRIWKNAPFGLA